MAKLEKIIKFEGKEWESILDKAFNKDVKNAKIDGFRKGHVTKELFINKYGVSALFESAANIAINDAFEMVLKDKEVDPIIRPMVDILTIDETHIELKFEIVNKPKVLVKKYKGLGVKKEEAKVTKDEIKKEIEKLVSTYAELIIKDGSVENGDTAVIDFEGFIEGVAFQGGKADNYSLEVGGAQFIPGFEEQIVGMKKSDTKDIKVKFPEDYHSEELKGKEALFKIKVNEIKRKELPKMDEDFFADLTIPNIKSESDLEKHFELELKAKKGREVEEKFVENLIHEAAKSVSVEIPEELIEEELHKMIDQVSNQVKNLGLSIEQYYEMTNSSESDMKVKFKDDAVRKITNTFMLEEIAVLEKLEVSHEEVHEKMHELCDIYGIDEETLLKEIGSEDHIMFDVLMSKVINFLKENNDKK